MFYKTSPIKSSSDIKRGVVSAPVYPDDQSQEIVSPPLVPRKPDASSQDDPQPREDGVSNRKLAELSASKDVKLTVDSVGVAIATPDDTKQLVYDRLLQSAALSMYTAANSPVPVRVPVPTVVEDSDGAGVLAIASDGAVSSENSDAQPDGNVEPGVDTETAAVEAATDADCGSDYFDDDEDHARVRAGVHHLDPVPQCGDVLDSKEAQPLKAKYQRVDGELLELASFLGSISHPSSSPHSVQSLETLLNLPVDTLYQQVLLHHEELEGRNISFIRTIVPMQSFFS
jgi:hypothetical protein